MNTRFFATLFFAASILTAQNVHNGNFQVLGNFDASSSPYSKPMPAVTTNPAGNSCSNAAAMELDTSDRLIAACISGSWVIVGSYSGGSGGGTTLSPTPAVAGTYFIGASTTGSATTSYGPIISQSFALSIMPQQAAYSLLGNLGSAAAAPSVISLPTTGTDGCNSTTQALGFSRSLNSIVCNNIAGTGGGGSSSGGTTIGSTPATAGYYFVGLYTSGPASAAYGPIASTPLSLSIMPTQAAFSIVANLSNSAAAPSAMVLPNTATDGCNDATHALGYSRASGAMVCNSISGGGGGGGGAGTYIDRVNRKVYYANGTYTPTTGVLYIDVEVQAAGGGSGGTPATGGSQVATSGGGGGGGYARQVFSASAIGSSQAITVGGAGTGGSSSSSGGAGGNASFGSLIVCTGGAGGALGYAVTVAGSDGNGGAGGSCSGGDYTVPGQVGTNGFYFGTGGVEFGGTGGASFWSPSTPPQAPGLLGNSGRGYGAGASGNSTNASGVASGGAAGGNGLVVITEYIAQ